MSDAIHHPEPGAIPSPVETLSATEMPGISSQQEILGNVLITIDRPSFLDGYLHGYKGYQRVGRYLPLTGSLLRDVLLKRCLEHPDQPSLWSTGYVLGWVTALQGLPRRQRLCPLELAPPHQHPASASDPVLSQAVPSLVAHPDFQQGLTDGTQAYRAEPLVAEEPEADQPSEEQLIHFFAGQVSYKAHTRAPDPVPYLYRVGYALAHLNAAVATLSGWPQSVAAASESTGDHD